MSSAASTGKANGFGALRLLFASLVILSHSPEMATGDRSRELLTRLFGTISFGDLAVDCFFLISGYLITTSMLGNPQDFLLRRVLRIYPAFIVCSALCLSAIAFLAGADLQSLSILNWVQAGLRILFLQPPMVPNVFAGTHHAALNGSMWTIAYEFRCYLLTYLLGRLGLLSRPGLIVMLGAAVLAGFMAALLLPLPQVSGALAIILGEPDRTLRLTAAYLAGASFAVARPPLRPALAWGAAILLTALMYSRLLAEPALFVFGGYALFTLALRFDRRWFRALNSRDDISYGLYLYAFPIGKLLFWYVPAINIWLHVAITLILSMAAGWLSWRYVEKGCLAVAHRKGRSRRSGPSAKGEGAAESVAIVQP